MREKCTGVAEFRVHGEPQQVMLNASSTQPFVWLRCPDKGIGHNRHPHPPLPDAEQDRATLLNWLPGGPKGTDAAKRIANGDYLEICGTCSAEEIE